jgi:16S rRNA (uracil1498-N3)-methyltransferase
MHIFYSEIISENKFHLNEEESKHAMKVLRLKEQDMVIVVDGKGTKIEAEILKADSKQTLIKPVKIFKEFEKRNFSIHIAIAPTKNSDRMEWFIEKSVEIGIDKISFINCQRSERKNINIGRMQKIAVSAMKQSQKAYLPAISEIQPFGKFIENIKEKGRFIAHLEEGEKRDLKNSFLLNENYCILIGPEGDFSEEEIRLAKAKGFIPVSLGASRLRTETAGIVACLTFNLFND